MFSFKNNKLAMTSVDKIIKITITAVILTIMFGMILAYNISIKDNQQFVYLTDSFIKGRLDFQPEHIDSLTARKDNYSLIWTDTSEWRGKRYWPLGPFPAVLLAPFVAIFGTSFLQGYISFALTLLNFFLLWRIARKLNHRNSDAVWLAAFFIFGTVYLGVAAFSVSWYFAQVVAVTLLLLSLHEYFYKKRWWLIGLYLALGIMTRNTLLFISLFFVLMIFGGSLDSPIKSGNDTKRWINDTKRWINGTKRWINDTKRWIYDNIKKILSLLTPILVACLLLLLYNWLRFGSPFEGGYNLQNIPPVLSRARDFGLFSLLHIPGNLYFLLFRGPDPVLLEPNTYVLKYPYISANIWGLGIFFTAPLFLYLFSAPWRDREVRAATIASLITLIPILTYYGIGVSQIGYRYILDISPLLYVILGKALAPKLPMKAKILIVLGIILNWHLLFHYRS